MRTNLAFLLLAMTACAPMDCGGPVVAAPEPVGVETDSDLPVLPLETPSETPVDAADEVVIS